MTVNNGRREASLIDIVDFSPSRSTETNSAGERKKKKEEKTEFYNTQRDYEGTRRDHAVCHQRVPHEKPIIRLLLYARRYCPILSRGKKKRIRDGKIGRDPITTLGSLGLRSYATHAPRKELRARACKRRVVRGSR